MDESEAGGEGFGDGGGDPPEQFHRNEAISAVVDEGFLGEEEDDYEDLYNDVNVGEGFLQSLRKSEDTGFKSESEAEKKPDHPLPTPPHHHLLSSTTGARGDGGEKNFENNDAGSQVPVRLDRTVDVGYSASEMVGRSSASGSVEPPSIGLRVELGQSLGKVGEVEDRNLNKNGVQNQMVGQQPHIGGVGSVGNVGSLGNAGNDGLVRQAVGNVTGSGGNVFGNGSGGMGGGVVGGGGGSGAAAAAAGAVVLGGVGSGSGGGGGAGTMLFVGDLHWWTTDVDLESELCKYGHVKEVKFFDEKASGKSKGYCQVEFYDPSAATACKEGMNGYVFNGRPCVVAYASPFSVKRMGEAQLNRNQQMAQAALAQARKGSSDVPVKPGGSNTASTGGNFQGGNYQGGSDNNNRGYGRGNWGRGNNPGMGGRGPVGPMRSRAGMGGRGIMANGGNGFGQGIGGTPPLLHPQTIMGQGFDPLFGGPIGRMGGYGGFPGGPTPPFSSILTPFPPVGNVGLPGVAPHVNPAFFGRGMPMGGIGMIPTSGVEGNSLGMWSDPSMGGWAGEDHGGRAGESSYGEEAMSDHHYGEVSHDRGGGGWSNAVKEKERVLERDWSGSSDRRYRDDREQGYDRDVSKEKDVGHDQDWSERRHHDDRDVGRDRGRSRDRERERERSRDRDRDRDRDRERDRHRDERDRFADHHKYRDHEPEYDDEWDRSRSSGSHSKSRMSQEEEQKSRSRDSDYGRKRRLTSE